MADSLGCQRSAAPAPRAQVRRAPAAVERNGHHGTHAPHALADCQATARYSALHTRRVMGRSFIDRTDPTFDDLGRRRSSTCDAGADARRGLRCIMFTMLA